MCHPSLPRYMVMVGVKQHKAHTPQRRKWKLTCKVYILLSSIPNFVAKLMVEINPLLIRWPKSTYVQRSKKNSIATRLATKKIWLLNLWWLKAFHHQSCSDGKKFVAIGLATEIGLILATHKLVLSNPRVLLT